jgi:hypothetical protein
MRLLCVAVLVLGLGLGCGSPDTESNEMCGPNGTCPVGFECNTVDRRCYRIGTISGDAAVDACVAGAVTVAVTSPTGYACHEPFKATVDVTNLSCEPVTIQRVRLTGTVTSGECAAPGPGSYEPTVTLVGRGQTARVLDLTGGRFCCAAQACPAVFMCDERYDFSVETSAGPLTASASTHLDLGGCDEVCP